MDKYQNLSHPILILVRGLPGSGKSFLAMELGKRIGNDAIVMLDPDATDYGSEEYLEHSKALTTEGVDPIIHPYRFLRGKAYKGITDHKIIIWNQPFTNLGMFGRMIDNLKGYAADHGVKLSLLIVEVEIDHMVARERIEKRKRKGDHGPSDSMFDRYVTDYVTAASEGYDVVTVHGEHDLTRSATTVLAALQTLI